MKKTALITGASSGIGLELAREHSKNGGDLVIVARSEDKLKQLQLELQQAYNSTVLVIAMDLALPNAAIEVYNKVKSAGITVDYLINNAGFGDFGMFVESDWNKEARMIQVNITCLTQFTKLFLKDMVQRKSGRIMNVASTAAFQSGPTMSVYYATKAYVLSFSEAIANEVKPYGVSVTTLCPGATASGFQDAAVLNESKLVKGKKLPTSAAVANYGYRAMLAGKTIAIHGWMNAIMANAVRFMPRSLVVKVTRFMQDK